MFKSFDDTLKTFNPSQKMAVQTLDGPLLISAGAGSGKTRALTYRIAFLLKQKKALPHQILAVTFTNKAATEMRERIFKIIKTMDIPIQSRMWINTFHSMCARILKDHQSLVGRGNKAFTIYDSKDQLSLVKKVMREMNISDQVYNPKTFASQIAACKRRALDPENIDWNNFASFGNRFQSFYFKYEKELKSAGAFDFEGLLLETYKLFLKHPHCLEKYRKQFRYISIDEYQDTNHIQYLIIKSLAEKHRNICAVGDEDQSIYSWRGADISNILNFDKDFPECKVVKLEQNYRSTKNIISSASALINHNKSRKSKQLFTDNPEGSLIQLYELEDEYQEAHLISKTIEERCQTQGSAYQDFAIFYRTNAQSRVLEEALRAKGLPYKIVGSLKFYDRMEIKDILSYLKCVVNTNDEVSLKRILNSPKRGIGPGAIQSIATISQGQNKSFYETIKYLSETNQIKGVARKGFYDFINIIEDLKKAKNSMSLYDFYTEVLNQTKYTQILKANNSIEALTRLENLYEFGNAINQFEKENEQNSLEDFLEEMALLAPADSKESSAEGVSLMTLHVSKGLEFDTVFITGMEDGLFPLSQNKHDSNLEEERRLAYVGMTRAQKNLYLSYAIKRNKFGKMQYNHASPFLYELPNKFIHSISLTQKQEMAFNKKQNQKHKGLFGDYVELESQKTSTMMNGSYQRVKSYNRQEQMPVLTQNPSSFSYRKVYKVGRTVRHPRFGAGKIKTIEGTGDDLRVSVVFKNQKVKKFIAKYAHLSL